MRGVLAFVLFLGIGIAIGVVTGGGFIHLLISYAIGVFFVLPALVVLVFAFAFVGRKDRVQLMDGFGRALARFVSVALGFVLGGVAIFQCGEVEVRSFVDEVLPLLDEHKKEFGRFPKDIGEVTDRSLPYCFRDADRGYRSDGATFTFYYENPDSIMGGLMLTDSHRSWSVAD